MSWRGLILQLFAVTVLPLTILVFVMTFGSVLVHERAMRTLVGERDERAARSLASALDTKLDHQISNIRSLALLAGEAESEGFDEVLERAGYLSKDFSAGLAFIEQDGTLLASSGDRASWENLMANSEIFTVILETLVGENGGISPAVPHPSTGKPVMFVAVFVDRPAVGEKLVAVGAFYPDNMARDVLVNAFDPQSHTAVLIMDAKEQVLYLSGATGFEGLAIDHPGIREALAGESGTTFLDVGADEHVVAYSPVPRVGWALAIEESWEMVASPLLNTSLIAPLTLVPILLIAFAALWFVARQVIRPLQALESQAAEMSWGDYESIKKPAGGIAEIRHLQTELVHMSQKVRAAQQSLHGYIGAMTTGQEEERRRLARELHDETIQSLVALKQRIQLARLNQNKSHEDMLTELESMTDETIDNLRRVTRALRPIYLEDLGLVTALEMLALETRRNASVPVDFQRIGEERRLDSTIELALYRIAQEALNNSVRHASATQIAIALVFTPQEVRLEVTDNGKGFHIPKSPSEYAPGGHFGLLGMHERAELIGADLEIQSAPGKGVRLSVRTSA